jgi:hypothetical protein
MDQLLSYMKSLLQLVFWVPSEFPNRCLKINISKLNSHYLTQNLFICSLLHFSKCSGQSLHIMLGFSVPQAIFDKSQNSAIHWS